MALTVHERMRVRKHLGYPQVHAAAYMHFGVPTPTATNYLVEQALDQILSEAEDEVRGYLAKLDQIETDLFENRDLVLAASIGDLELRPTDEGLSSTDALEREYRRWAARLGDLLGVPLNPYAEKFFGRGSSRSSSVNVRVRR